MQVTSYSYINYDDLFLAKKNKVNISFLKSSKNFTKIVFVLLLTILLTSKFYAQENELDKLLQLDLEELTDLKIISATKRLNRISRVPATVEVITAERIKENEYLTLEEVLSDLPGFQFRNILGFNSYVFQRGIPNQNNYTLLLVDGNEINELNSGGFYGGGQFNLDNVEQIEVVYGPASSLYGTNAISGVINILTKDPERNEGLKISGLGGTFNTYKVSGSYDYYDADEKAGFRIAGMFFNTEKANLAGAEGDYNWSPEMENFETDYTLNVKSVYKDFKFGLLYQNKRAARTTNYKSVGTDYLDKNTLWNIGFLNTYIKHYSDISEVLNVQSKIVYRNSTVYDNTIAYVTDTSQVGYYRPSYSLRGESILYYIPTEYLKITGGAVFEAEWLAENFSVTYSESSNVEPEPPSSPNLNRNDLFSLYLQTELNATDFLSLFVGGRYDHSTVYGNVITPRAGLVYNKSGFSLKALYSEAFRAPEPWDYTSGLGNSNLDPEKMRSFELAAGYYFTKHSHLSISYYSNKLLDIITQQKVDNNFRWVNDEAVKVEGLETGAELRYDFIRIDFNYTYNHAVDNEGRFLSEISKHTANFGVSVNFLDDIRLSVRGNYIGKRNNPSVITTTGSNLIDDAVVFHSSLHYSGIEKLVLTLSVKNLLDTEYFHTSNRPPDRYRQPQRTLLLAVDYSL